MPESAIDILTRWEDHGAVWRVVTLSERRALVDLCTCHGEPVDRLRSEDPEVIAWLRRAEEPGSA